jgi:small-conductance mechanosensitive channel
MIESRATWAALLAAALASSSQGGVAPDLGTPRRSLRLFVEAGRAGDWERAAEALDLAHYPPERRADAGARLARELKVVLDQSLWIELDEVPDSPAAPAPSADRYLLGAVSLDGERVPIALARVAGEAGASAWLISRATLERVPALYARYGPGWLGEHLPEVLFRLRFAEIEAWQWIGLLLMLLASVAGGWSLAKVGIAIAERLARRTEARWDDRLIAAVRGPSRFLMAILLLGALLPLLRLAIPAREAIERTRVVGLLLVATWLGLHLVTFLAETALDALAGEGADDSRRRGVRTQITVLQRIASVVVGVVGSGMVLTQFEIVRHLGVSILASAGIAGMVVGLAAQKPIASLLAGLQLSLTQPVRIGDTVIVEGEWGWVEEIHLTYVVVKVWDLRRLVVPIGTFLDKPFQNWTKVSPEILGTVEIPADFATPVEEVRKELTRLVQGNPNWDGKVAGLQVTAATERTMTLRALVSSPDASKCWDLRCAVREGLIRFLQRLEGGRYLPRTRFAQDAPPALPPAERNVLSER